MALENQYLVIVAELRHLLFLSFLCKYALCSRFINLPLRGFPLIMNGILSPRSSPGPHCAVCCAHSTAMQREMKCPEALVEG